MDAPAQPAFRVTAHLKWQQSFKSVELRRISPTARGSPRTRYSSRAGLGFGRVMVMEMVMPEEAVPIHVEIPDNDDIDDHHGQEQPGEPAGG